MKRKITAILILMCIAILLLPACNIDKDQSVKAVTAPYIAQYECTQARLGETDILEKYEYIRIIFLNKDELEVQIKRIDGEKQSAKGNYSIDPDTRELTGEIGILGFKFREKVIVKNGQFTISKNFGSKPLFVKFEII